MKKRVAVVLGLLVAGCASTSHRWGNAGGVGTIVLRESADGCKKRYVTRALNTSRTKGPKTLTWLLVNACDAVPRTCGNEPLALEFAKWQYTKKLLGPEEEPDYSSITENEVPFDPRSCKLKNPTPLGSTVDVACKLRDDAKTGTYRFQAVLSCGGKVVDNWDPVIIVED